MCIADPSDRKLVLLLSLLPIRERASRDWALAPFSGSCHFGAPVSFCSLDHSGYVRLFTLPGETHVSPHGRCPWCSHLLSPGPGRGGSRPGEVWPCLFPVSLPEGADFTFPVLRRHCSYPLWWDISGKQVSFHLFICQDTATQVPTRVLSSGVDTPGAL